MTYQPAPPVSPTASVSSRGGCRIIEHPLLQHALTQLRDAATSSIEFRRLMHQMGSLMAYEAMRDIAVRTRPVQTPLEATTGSEVADDVVIVSIWRSGAGMVDGMLDTLPFATMGHIGIYHDRLTQNTIEYYFRLPQGARGKIVLLVDPFIGSGKTAAAAIERLREYEVGEIRFVSLLVSPDGIERIGKNHPDVTIYTLAIERGLNEHGFLVPGVGDAGERLYGSSDQ